MLGIFLKKLNTELPDDPAILLLGVYPREIKTHVLTKTRLWIFLAVLLIICKAHHVDQCPSYKCTDKRLYFYNGIQERTADILYSTQEPHSAKGARCKRPCTAGLYLHKMFRGCNSTERENSLTRHLWAGSRKRTGEHEELGQHHYVLKLISSTVKAAPNLKRKNRWIVYLKCILLWGLDYTSELSMCFKSLQLDKI